MTGRGVALAAAWAASVALAFVVARRPPAAAPSGATPPPSSSSTITVRERCAAAAEAGLSAEEIRAILREELATGDVRPEPVAETTDPTPAYEPALAFVEEALARGVWTASDRDGLRSRLSGLTRDEVESLFAMVVPAANDGSLRVEGIDGPLL